MIEHTLSRKSRPAPIPTPKPAPAPKTTVPLVHHATASGGTALDTKTQHQMGSRFGHDFSQVRIYTDTSAAASAQALGANAYTQGSNIVFGPGHYAPGTREGDRLIAHELTHVTQQARYGVGDPSRLSRREDASEQEAEQLASQIMQGQDVQVQASPQAAFAREEEEGFLSSLASGAGSLLKSGWEGTKSTAGAVYDGYEKQTDFKSLQSGNAKLADESKGQWGEGFVRGGVNGEIDSLEKLVADGNQKSADEAKGHWYEGLVKGSGWLSNKSTEMTGGLLKGVGDIGFGIANGLAHPIDAAAGIEGILEHNMTVPGLGTTLKAGHALYDLAAKDDPKDRQYGSSVGDIANHLFNPMQQVDDDAKFDTNLATGIIAPDKNKDGTTDWSAWKNKPLEAATRAATNIAPVFLGMGEADAAKAADVAQLGDVSEAANASHTPTLPGIGPDLPPVTERGMPTMPGVQPGRTPTIPGFDPAPPLPDILPPTERGLPPTERGIPPTERGIPPTQPEMISPKATTGEVPARSPISPKATTVEAPAVKPVEAPSAPVKTRNPVQQMDAVDPSKMYPGAPEPPGFRSGPVTPNGFPQELPPASPKPISELFPELYEPQGGDPNRFSQRGTGTNQSNLQPSAPPDVNHPVFQPAPELPEPSVDSLLRGLENNPMDGRTPTRPMFDPMPGSLEEVELLLRNLR